MRWNGREADVLSTQVLSFKIVFAFYKHWLSEGGGMKRVG